MLYRSKWNIITRTRLSGRDPDHGLLAWSSLALTFVCQYTGHIRRLIPVNVGFLPSPCSWGLETRLCEWIGGNKPGPSMQQVFGPFLCHPVAGSCPIFSWWVAPGLTTARMVTEAKLNPHVSPDGDLPPVRVHQLIQGPLGGKDFLKRAAREYRSLKAASPTGLEELRCQFPRVGEKLEGPWKFFSGRGPPPPSSWGLVWVGYS